MEKVRIAIVEDDADASELLLGYLNRYGGEKKANFEILRFYDSVTFLENYRNGHDIVFMDIELPDGNGMDVVAKLREKDKDVIVIFVTNMAQYAVKGYEVRAFDFIVKPVSYANFSVKLTGALELFRQKRGKDIWISNKDGKTRIRSSRIKYVEVVQHMLIFHTLDGDYKASGALGAVQEQLTGEPFALCNRCYFVNLRFVTAVRQFEVSLGGETLQISRLKRNSFMVALNDHLAGGD